MKKRNLIKSLSIIMSMLMLTGSITTQAIVVTPTIKDVATIQPSEPTVVTPTVKETEIVIPTVVTESVTTEATDFTEYTEPSENTEHTETTIPTISTETIPTVSTETTTPTETVSTEATEPTETEPSSVVTDISVTKSLTVYVNKKAKLKVVITNGIGETLYTSYDTDIVEVTSDGILIPKRKGATIITVENNGVTAYVVVNVKKPQIKKNIKIYKGFTHKIKITGKSGKATYTSKNTRIATVNGNGKITARNKGSTKIIIKVNGVTLVSRVKVKKPALEDRTISINRGFTEKIKINGKKGKTTYFSKNKNVATINRNGKITAKTKGVANFIAKTNGYILSGKIIVKNNNVKKLLKVNTYQKKKNLELGIGEKYPLSKLVNVETNLKSLLNKNKITDNQYKLWLSNSLSLNGNVTDNSVATINDGYIIPKNTGNTTIEVETFNGDVYTFNLTVNKTEYTTYNNKKAKIVYSYRETYDTLEQQFFDNIIKGDAPDYEYLICSYYIKDKTAFKDTLYEYADKDYQNGRNFNAYLRVGSWEYNSLALGCWIEDDNLDGHGYNKVVQINTENIKQHKALYNKAMEIFDEINVDDFINSYEKTVVINCWINNNCSYSGIVDSNKSSEYNLLVLGDGVCSGYAKSFRYLCTLQNIPCTRVHGYNHAFNAVKLQDGNWYYIDPLDNTVFFDGNDTLSKMPRYNISSIEGSLTIKDVSDDKYIKDEDEYDLIVMFFDGIWTPVYTRENFGWE